MFQILVNRNTNYISNEHKLFSCVKFFFVYIGFLDHDISISLLKLIGITPALDFFFKKKKRSLIYRVIGIYQCDVLDLVI